MDATARRLLELEEIFRFAINGLRSKARVAANDHVSGNKTDPVLILNTLADELQTYLGCSIANDQQAGSTWFLCNQVEVTIDGLTRQFGPLKDNGIAARAMVDIEQQQVMLRHPQEGTVAARPAGLVLRIEIHPEPNSEISLETPHDGLIH